MCVLKRVFFFLFYCRFVRISMAVSCIFPSILLHTLSPSLLLLSSKGLISFSIASERSTSLITWKPSQCLYFLKHFPLSLHFSFLSYFTTLCFHISLRSLTIHYFSNGVMHVIGFLGGAALKDASLSPLREFFISLDFRTLVPSISLSSL